MRHAIAFALALSVSSIALAQDHGKHPPATPSAPAPSGHADSAGAKPGMQHGAMSDMHAHMRAMHEHSRMMQGVSDPKRLDEDMKRHMRMMDEMMEAMMKAHGSASAPSDAPHQP